jgi:hypothetical protein
VLEQSQFVFVLHCPVLPTTRTRRASTLIALAVIQENVDHGDGRELVTNGHRAEGFHHDQ